MEDKVLPMPGDLSAASSSSEPNTSSKPLAYCPVLLALQSTVLIAPVPLLPVPFRLGIPDEGEAGDVDKSDGGRKLPTDTGLETRGGAGRAEGIGIEEGT